MIYMTMVRSELNIIFRDSLACTWNIKLMESMSECGEEGKQSKGRARGHS